jgi:predicted PurR-regulated permease PerM
MPHDERLLRALLILGILSALIYLGRFLWDVGRSLSSLILLLALAWLVAYVLSPIAHWLNGISISASLIKGVRERWGDRPAERLVSAHIPYALAAVSLYLVILITVIAVTVLAVPGIIKQLGQLANQVPDYIEQVPEWWEGIQDAIVRRFDVDPETLGKAVPVDRFTQEATSALPDVIGNAVTVVQTVATGIANMSLMLILSLYMMLDSRRLSDQFYRLVPIRYQDEFQFIFGTFDRTFGGFLRGQVLMVVITIIFTGLVMRLFGLQFTLITAILAGLVMFIPELGAPIALFAPSVASALQGSDATIPLFIIVLVFQQILLRFVMPKILSEAIGMPPLLVLVSVLISARIAGFWGFFFGVPVAGAIYIIAIVTLEQIKQTTDAQDRQREVEEENRHAVDPYE